MSFKRLRKLQAQIKNPILIKKKENLFYLTGRSFMSGYLLIKPSSALRASSPKGRRGHAVVFFGDGLELAPGMKSDRLKNIPLYLGKAPNLELEDEFTFKEYEYIKQKISAKGGSAFGGKDPGLKIKITHVKSPVDYQRQVKDASEIAKIRKSMQIVEAVFLQIKKRLCSAGPRPAITELGLANFIRSAGLKLGAEDVSFPPIVASGVNAAIPHHVPSSKRLKAGESIIIDFGFKYKNYCSDFTRTVFLKKVHPKLELAYNQVEKAYNESINFVSLRGSASDRSNLKSKKGLPRPSAALGARNDTGVMGGDVYQKAVDVLAEKGLDKYFIHSLGHGTGLEIHELPNLSPNSKDILKPGMVFSIEPGVYIPRLGGIRIEDLVYLKGNKVNKFIYQPTRLEENIL